MKELQSKVGRIDAQTANLRVMHCPDLRSLHGIEHLRNLQHLNASSNCLQSLEGIETLERLVYLNLSCNQLTKVGKLPAGL